MRVAAQVVIVIIAAQHFELEVSLKKDRCQINRQIENMLAKASSVFGKQNKQLCNTTICNKAQCLQCCYRYHPPV